MSFQLPSLTLASAFLSSNPHIAPITTAFITDLFLSQFYEPATDLLLFIYTLTNLTFFYTSNGLSSWSTVFPIFIKNFIFWFSWFLISSIRRLYFHPLSNIPGPKLRAITGLVETYDFMRGRNAKSFCLSLLSPLPHKLILP